jgi:hypothetical protein
MVLDDSIFEGWSAAKAGMGNAQSDDEFAPTTQALSRSFTIMAALRRMGMSGSVEAGRDSVRDHLVIHLVGADYR